MFSLSEEEKHEESEEEIKNSGGGGGCEVGTGIFIFAVLGVTFIKKIKRNQACY